MQVQISELNSLDGWDWSIGGSMQVTDWTHLTGSRLTNQLLLKASAANVRFTLTLPTPIPIKDYPDFGLSIKADADYNDFILFSDFALKIKLQSSNGSTLEYYLPANETFQQMTFYNNLDDVVLFEIIAIKPCEFFISDLIAYHDDIPWDIFNAINEDFNRLLDLKKFPIGKIWGNKGENTAKVDRIEFIDKYASILVDDGLGTILQIQSDVSNRELIFTPAYYSDRLPMDYDGVDFYLYIPIQFKVSEADAIIPGIGISQGFDAEVVEDEEEYSPMIDSISLNGTARYRTVGSAWKYTFLIECMSRHDEIMEYLHHISRQLFNKKTIIWINGRKHEVAVTSIETPDYGDATDILSKSNMTLTIEIIEESWQQIISLLNFQTIAVGVEKLNLLGQK